MNKEIIMQMTAQLIPFIFTFDDTIDTDTAIKEAKNLAIAIYRNIEQDKEIIYG